MQRISRRKSKASVLPPAQFLPQALREEMSILNNVSGKLDDLIPQITKHNGEKYLYVVSEVQKNDGESVLEKNKVNYTRAVMYRTVSNDFQEGEAFDYDMLIFFSPTGIKSLQKNFHNFEQGDIKVACLGTKTIKAAEEAGIHVDFQPTPELRSVPAIIEAYAKTLK